MGLFTRTRLNHSRLREIYSLLEICQRKLNEIEKNHEETKVREQASHSALTDASLGRYYVAQQNSFAELKASLQAELRKIDEEIASLSKLAKKRY